MEIVAYNNGSKLSNGSGTKSQEFGFSIASYSNMFTVQTKFTSHNACVVWAKALHVVPCALSCAFEPGGENNTEERYDDAFGL